MSLCKSVVREWLRLRDTNEAVETFKVCRFACAFPDLLSPPDLFL